MTRVTPWHRFPLISERHFPQRSLLPMQLLPQKILTSNRYIQGQTHLPKFILASSAPLRLLCSKII
jgi:hypothetical protein